MSRSLLDCKVLVVTGKGGTGKTVVAAALARLAQAQGKRVLLAGLARGETMAELVGGAEPAASEPTRAAAGLDLLVLEPEAVARDFFRVVVRSDFAARQISGNPLFRAFLYAAPGLKELLYLGKLWYLTTRNAGGGKAPYDLAVLDGPATGHALALLSVPAMAEEVFAVGPMRPSIKEIEAFYRDPARCGVVITSTPEELPVSEAADLYEAARSARMPTALSVLNREPPEPFSRGSGAAFRRQRRDPVWNARAAEWLGSAADLEAVLATAGTLSHRRRAADALARRLRRDVPLPTVTLPALPSPALGAAELDQLAQRLKDGLSRRGLGT